MHTMHSGYLYQCYVSNPGPHICKASATQMCERHITFYKVFFWGWGLISADAQELLLVLCSGINLDSALFSAQGTYVEVSGSKHTNARPYFLYLSPSPKVFL